ncbi:PspC domain-containing protein [Flavobacterium sp. TP390]|uniref:PspC domain-containing protein n=1 Tax=Flavobacterium profundi TaxID=1774945 RepID=A0A6I4IU28_9FLAO|nr:PspC domain-containing protein [Flavobacterium profundi]MVO10399.1 PspC domain-containing protein [Flavobacterium profundi]
MNKTISINLGGFFFHIDEDAYQKLSRYFDAVKRSLSPEGRDEIIKDIESRIAELFQERIKNEKQVITLSEIDEVIAIMGQPEDYKIDEETSYSNERTYTSSSKTGRNKRLYRDKDNAILGGVASGFGHYFNIDPLWIRLGIVLIVVAGVGSPILIYLLLWVIVPEAITTSQKLEMRGEPITISNIEKKVKEGINDISDKINNIDHQKIANSARSGANQIGATLSDLFLSFFKIISKVIGLFIIFFSAMALLGILIGSIFMIFSSSLPDSYIFNNFHTPLDFDVPMWIQGLLLLFAAGIPLFFLLVLGIKLLVTNMKSLGNNFKYSLLAIWIVALIGITYLGIQQATAVGFEGKSVKKEQIFIQPTDTLFVRMQYNNYYAKSLYERENHKYTHDENNKEIIYSTKVRVHFLKTEENQPFLQVERSATGKSHKEATSRSEKIRYNFDIQGNRITLDNYFTTAFGNKFRDQEVNIYIYLPNGTYVKPDESIQDYDRSDNDFFNLHYDSDEYIYQVEGNKTICTNCPVEDNDEESDNEDEDTVEKMSIRVNNKEINIDVTDDRLRIEAE